MTYLGLDVKLHGLDRWGPTLTPEEVAARALAALRAVFPEYQYSSDITVDIEESA